MQRLASPPRRSKGTGAPKKRERRRLQRIKDDSGQLTCATVQWIVCSSYNSIVGGSNMSCYSGVGTHRARWHRPDHGTGSDADTNGAVADCRRTIAAVGPAEELLEWLRPARS